MGHEQLRKAGAEGRTDAGGLYPEQVIGVWDERHFLFGKVPTERYNLDDKALQDLISSIGELGWKQPGIVWYFDDTGESHVLCGNRRTFATQQINNERLEQGQDPIRGYYTVAIKKSLTNAVQAEALEVFADTNNTAKGNDWLTVACAAAQQLRIGVSMSAVLSRWPMIESETMLEQLAADNGVRAACPELQTALASGQIPIKRAMRIARLPLSEQVAAMTGKREKSNKMPAAVSMVKLAKVRDALRDDKRLEGVTAADVLACLTGCAETNAASLIIGHILTEKGKPGRKPQPKADGLTDQEREETQRFLDAEAVKREEEEAEKKR